MSAGMYARRARSAVDGHAVLLAFAAIYLAVMALSLAAVRALEPRLPAEARDLASSWLGSELFATAMYLVWIAVPRPDRMRYALETMLPIGLYVLGMSAGALTATLWLNLDATAFQMPLGTLPGLGLMALGMFAGWRLGRHLGDRATAGRLRREAASSRRSAWFAETSPDGSWRRATGITMGLIMVPLILLAQATSPAYTPGSPLPVQLLAAGAWALAVLVGDHATVSITDAAIRVRARSLSSNSTGWSVSLAEVQSAHVIAARPELLAFDRSRCVLRTGPALEIRTVTGGRYAVSMEEAGEAVAVIEALRSGAPANTPEDGIREASGAG